MSEAKNVNDILVRPAWPHLAEKRRSEIRAHFNRQQDPEWVLRIERALAYVAQLRWAHANHWHDADTNGAHIDCPDCELQLDADELLREHRGW